MQAVKGSSNSRLVKELEKGNGFPGLSRSLDIDGAA